MTPLPKSSERGAPNTIKSLKQSRESTAETYDHDALEDPTVTVQMEPGRKRRRSDQGPDWQHKPDLKESKIKIGTLVVVNNGQEHILGKVLGRRGATWFAQRWRARNTTAPGIKKRFFPTWEKSGKIFITAHPPRSSTPVQFQFVLDDVICSGFNLFASMPDDAALDFVGTAGLTVNVVIRPDGTETRRTWT